MTSNSFKDYLRARQAAAAPMADAAIAIGLPVFPCGPTKQPMTAHGFKDASADPEQIRKLFGPTACMIGMPTGEITGLVVVDIDIKENRQGGAWLDAQSARMPQTRTIRTASGGLHIYFKHPGKRVKNQNDKIAPGVDIRGDGGYVIVPPSKGYAVADDAPVADIPDWLLPILCPPEPVAAPVASAPRQSVSTSAGGTPYGLAALQDECDAIRSAGFGNQEHTLNASGLKIGALVAGGELESGAALADLLSAARSMSSQPGRAPWSPSQLEFKARRAFDDGKKSPRAAPDFVPVTPADEIHPAAAMLTALAKKQAKVQSKPLPVPVGMMDVGGALGMFVEHCERTAISSQPLLALAAGICLIGVVAGRKYRTETNLRTNIYNVGVADSGAGKDHARKAIRSCLSAAGLSRYVGGENIASGQAVFTALTRHPAALFQIDEFGDFMADVLGERASAHRRDIASKLKTLYSSAGTDMPGTEYADAKLKPREDVKEPHACLYATTTPGQLWAAIAGKSMHDGLMARMLLFVSPCSYPDESDPVYQEPPRELITALQSIASGGAPIIGGGTLPCGPFIPIMSSTKVEEVVAVPNSRSGQAAYKAMRLEQIEWQRQNEGTYITAIVGRMAENAMKLALVRAVSRSPSSPIIDADDVAWGRLVVKHCIDTLLREAAVNVAESEHEARLNKVEAIVRKHGPISEYEMISRKTGLQTLNERDRKEMLRTLVETGKVIARECGGGQGKGRRTIRYEFNPSGMNPSNSAVSD